MGTLSSNYNFNPMIAYEADAYMRFEKYKKMYPHYLKVVNAKNTDELKEVSNLND